MYSQSCKKTQINVQLRRQTTTRVGRQEWNYRMSGQKPEGVTERRKCLVYPRASGSWSGRRVGGESFHVFRVSLSQIRQGSPTLHPQPRARSSSALSLWWLSRIQMVSGRVGCKHRQGRTEDNLIAFFPHLGNQGLTRVYHTGEPEVPSMSSDMSGGRQKDRHIPNFYVFELTKALQHMLARNAHGAVAWTALIRNRSRTLRQYTYHARWVSQIRPLLRTPDRSGGTENVNTMKYTHGYEKLT